MKSTSLIYSMKLRRHYVYLLISGGESAEVDELIKKTKQNKTKLNKTKTKSKTNKQTNKKQNKTKQQQKKNIPLFFSRIDKINWILIF